ncbi:polyketide synthase [Prosthecobacter sp.]|uniref:polyketide synthase n=1 Tax=Prosthecobacter sp. TaxID=1965333 RepID=UPI002AB8DEAD|nr:polyketide synthase [Prosthecobacter sp.]MDZ4403436.1 thioester reductase domain-containing protein [Prosthecobacter sp.]
MPVSPAFEPIAIIGIGCRLPGGANNAESYWKMLLDGVDAIREVPQSRWDSRFFYDPEQGKPGKTYSKWAGLIDEIDTFDPAFFGITQREAPFIDPQQRLLLEATWEALLDAGQQVDIAKGEDTGVFVGISTHDYSDIQLMDSGRAVADAYSATGSASSIAANRISYALNFQGPSMAVDTACSSSMVAVHLACKALWNKECHRAIAAGVNCIISAYPFVAFSSMSMLSPDGRCKAFDASADGFVRGEGVGAVCLKPLSAALADGDSIYAVIRSTAVNQDGRTSGMTVPSRGSQQELVAEACRLAGVSPHEIQYVEAHGTGTTIGDLIEGSALGTILGVGRKPGEDCLVGSVKTNIGHLEAGSGIAGLIKLALCLKHGVIPPNLHFKNPNPSLNFERLRLKVPLTATPLKKDAEHRLLACINSFGFGGTNAHAVLEAAPEPDMERPYVIPSDGPELLLPLSARGSDAALTAVARSFQSYLESADKSLHLNAICAAASRRRTHHELRLAVIGRTRSEMAESLAAFLRGEADPGLHSGQPVKNARLVFVFSGQGPQWWAMGRELLANEPVFRQTIQACHDELIKLGGWSLLDELQRGENETRLDETQIAQIALFSLQVALAALWKSWGVSPYAVVGHSMGEVAAAHACGALDLPTAMRVIYHRGRCMEQTPLRGKMIAAALTREDAEERISRYGGRVSLAAVNGPQMVSISGDADAVDEIFHDLESKASYVRRVPVNYAFHSAHMDPVQGELAAALEGLKPQAGNVKIYSSVTGQLAEGTDYDADYWWRNVRQSVLFAPAIESLIAAGHTHFLEISPHPVLSNSITECLTSADTSGLVLPSLRRQKPERATMLGSLAELHVHGHEVAWSAQYPQVSKDVRLPDYPWQKDRYWHEPAFSLRLRANPPLNPLIKLSLQSIHPTWETPLRKNVLTWLRDHRVGQHIIFPGAGYVEMALAAARELHKNTPVVIEELEIHRGCILPAGDEAPIIQIACLPAENSFVIQSTLTEDTPSWTQHVTGRLRPEPERAPPGCFDLDDIKRRCPHELDGGPFYQSAASADLHYGPHFQGMTHVWAGSDEALGRIEVPTSVVAEMDRYEIHPALLDACIHPTIAIPADGLYLPARMERIRCYSKPGSKVWAYVRKTRAIEKKIIVVDLFILDDAGQVLLEITGFLCKYTAMSSAPGSGAEADWLYQPQWHLKPLAACTQARSLADYLPDNITLAAQLRQNAARFSAGLGMNQRYQEWEPRLNQLSQGYILATFKQLGWRPKLQETVTLKTLMKRLKVLPAHERLLRRLLTLLEKEGLLTPASAAEEPAWTVTVKPAAIHCDKLWREIVFHFPSFHPELILLDRCASSLADLLRGERDPAQALSVNMLEHFQAGSVFTRVYNHLIGEAMAAALARLPEGRPVRILEIGAGTGGVTASVLPRLPRENVSYRYTDVTDRFFDQAAQKFGDHPFVQYQVLDLDLPPDEQSLAEDRFDIILLSNALSLTTDVQKSLRHARQLLASGGLLVLLETERPSAWHDLVLGMNERWWSFQDTALRANHPLLKSADWQKLLAAADFANIEAITDSDNTSQTGQVVLLAQGPEQPQTVPQAAAQDQAEAGSWLIFADKQGVAQKLADALRQRGETCLLVKAAEAFQRVSADEVLLRPSVLEDFTQLLAPEHRATPLRGVVHLWSLDAPAGWDFSTAALVEAQTLVCHSSLHLMQALNTAGLPAWPGLCFVTRGAQPVGMKLEGLSLTQSPLHGMVRVIMSEHAEARCRSIDLDPSPGARDTEVLVNELLYADAEDEIAWRGEARHALRLVHGSLDNLALSSQASLNPDQGFRLESAKPGSLDKLVFRAKPRRAPGPGEVEIEVCAAALNFRDVMKALGIYPAEAEDAMLLGDECAGHIVRVGEGVTEFKAGDEVMALAAGCFGTYVTTVTHAVLLKPPHLTMEEAATMMVTYLTASYALQHQGRMVKGERVLIHAGTGGVGQAAVRLSQAVGAEIFATAGSAEKRAFLKKIGVQQVLDSRTLSFGEEIMQITHGEGVDLVLNSLAGEAIHQSLSVLRQYGRFLEIGKRDIYGNTKVGLFPFRKNLSYHAIDLGHALDPKNAKPLMRNLRQLIATKKLPPLPYRTFALSDAVRAFRYITQARQIGKVVLTVQDARVDLTETAPSSDIQLDPAATYLVAGGLGGFGLAMSQWLVEKGARHLVLSSRSGISTDEARDGVAAMQAAGATVTVMKSNVSDPASVTALLQEIKASQPPLRGVFHVAMVLDDGLIPQLNVERFQKVTTPKINGAWNLHLQTQDMPLDHFVMFSSVASLIGSPAQANYAAANAFLDALANHRRLQGLPALTINWGVMAGVGYVARHKKLEEHFERIGWSGLTPAQTLPILGRLLQQPAISQMMVSRIDWTKWAAVSPRLITTPRYALLTTENALKQHKSEGADWLRESVLKASAAEQIGILETFLCGQVAKVLRTSPNKIDTKRPLNDIGIDSLMAVELIHQIESQIGIAIPTGQLMGGAPTIQKLAEIVLNNLTGGKVEPAPAPPQKTAADTTAAATDSFVKDADLAGAHIPFAAGIVETAQIKQPSNIFLTGASDFLGAYLLKELLLQTHAHIHCLIKANDESSAMRLIEDHLTRHECWEDSFRSRIFPVPGDLGQPLFGLDQTVFDHLASIVDVIYHATAHINHIAPYEQLKAVNVNGTLEIIRLAAQSRLKPVHCLSSVSVLGARCSSDDQHPLEDEPLTAHEKLTVGYCQSRWVSEQLFLQARERGLPVNIYRPGLLTGDARTGICPPDDIVWLFLKACIEIGLGPDATYNSLLTPVDYTAAAMLRLSQKITGPGRNFHLVNPASPSFGSLLRLAVANNYPIHIVGESEWEAALTDGRLKLKQNPLAAHLLFIPRQILSHLVEEKSAEFCRNTLQGLQGTGVSCPPIDHDRMHLYLDFFVRTGFLPPPAHKS